MQTGVTYITWTDSTAASGYVYPSATIVPSTFYVPTSATMSVVDWDSFRELRIRVGDKVIPVSKEQLVEVFKLFPKLAEKFCEARFAGKA